MNIINKHLQFDKETQYIGKDLCQLTRHRYSMIEMKLETKYEMRNTDTYLTVWYQTHSNPNVHNLANKVIKKLTIYFMHFIILFN